MLETMADMPVSSGCKERTMAGLGRAIADSPVPQLAHGELPRPLARMLGTALFEDIRWKWKAPGVAMCDVKLPRHATGRLTLMRIGGGRAMPEHGHGGEEVTLVLKGAYRDHMGRFAEGDVADLDEEIEHRPVVDEGEDCICLVATERPTRFKSMAARIFQPFVGI